MHFNTLHIAEYFIQENTKGTVDTLYRKYKMTARQAVQEFGEDNLGTKVKEAVKDKPDTQFNFIHAVEPTEDYKRATGKTKAIFNLALIFGILSVSFVSIAAINFSAIEVLIVSLIFKFFSRFAGLIYSSRVMKWKIKDMIPWQPLFKITITCIFLHTLCSSTRHLFKSDMTWVYFCAPSFAILYFVILARKFKQKG